MRHSSDIRSFLARELVAGEVVRWKGQPDPSLRVSRYEIPIVALACLILLAGMALVGAGVSDLTTESTYEIENGNTDTWADLVFFSIFSGILLGIGFYLSLGRLIVRRSRRQRTWYLLTDRRVFEVHLNRRRRLLAIPLDKISGVQSEVSRNGRGSVSFGDGARGWSSRMALADLSVGPLDRANDAGLVFHDVPDVDDLLDLLRVEQWSS